MKQRTFLGLVLLIGGSIFIGSGCTASDSCGYEAIKVGAILPLTGNVSIFGQWIKEGMELALTDIEKTDPELKGKITIIYEDSQNDAKTGVSSLNKLITVDDVSVVVSAMSKVTIPLIPIVEGKKIPLFMQDVTYPKITTKGIMLFRHFIQSNREASAIAKHAAASGIKSVGILYVNDEAGLGAKDSFDKSFADQEHKITIAESYEPSETDVKSHISKIMSTQAEAIYLFGNGPSWAISLKQIKELGFKGAIFTNTAMYIPNFRKIAGNESIEGVTFTYPYMDNSLDSVKKFIILYKSRYGYHPSIESAYAWDIIHIIAKSVKAKKNTTYDKLLSVDNVDGAFGKISIPKDKDIKTNIGIGIIKNGQIIHMDTTN